MGIISVLILIVCALLTLVVLVQNSKGGGLASGFASNNQIMGVRRTSDFIEKATWGLAAALLILSLLSTPKTVIPGEGADTGTGSVTKGRANTAMPTPGANTKPATPVTPTTPGK